MRGIVHFLIISFVFHSCISKREKKSIENAPSFSVDWEYADSIRKEIKEAAIPLDTFHLAKLVKTSNHQQIQEAINKVSQKGGGTLIISKGIYNSGPIRLKSKVGLYLEEGAIIKFVPYPELYPLVYTWFRGIPCMNYSSMIYARNETNIKISGKGIVDGQGYSPAWKNMKYYEKVDWELLKELDDKKTKVENRKFGMGHSLRPGLISFYGCSGVTITGITILNSPYFVLHPVLSKNITIKNATIKSKGYNQIGIAIESSKNVLIDSMQIEEVGEGIKMLSGSVDIPGNMASSNIIIQNSAFRNISYTPVIFSSKSIKGINRAFISGLHMDNSEAGICIYGQQNVKTHDVFIKDISAKNISGSFLYGRLIRTQNTSPVIFGIQLDNIQVKDCGRAFVLMGNEINPIQNININNSGFNVSKGSFAKQIRRFNLKNVEINGKTITGAHDIGDNKIPEIYLSSPEDEVLDSYDIQYNNLPVTVKNTLDENYAYIPINDIDRIITSSNVIYELDLELESFQNIEILVQMDGEVIRSELEIHYKDLPENVITALAQYLGTHPIPFFFNKIKEIQYKDFAYYEIIGEFNQKLFAVGISKEGKIIEEKQQTITSNFSFD